MENVLNPINLRKWVENNQHLLKPPVCNKVVFEEDEAFIMLIGGANARQEYHYNEAPEFFYQHKGDMLLKVREGDEVRDIPIREGEMFFLPARVSHSPIRFDNTVGLVVDMRHATGKDGLQWFCPKCDELVYEAYLKVSDIENDFDPVYENFYSDQELHTCKRCNYKFKKPQTLEDAPSHMKGVKQ